MCYAPVADIQHCLLTPTESANKCNLSIAGSTIPQSSKRGLDRSEDARIRPVRPLPTTRTRAFSLTEEKLRLLRILFVAAAREIVLVNMVCFALYLSIIT
jgi:hypothetical protein